MTHNFYLGVAGFGEKHTRSTNQDRIFPTPDTLPTRLSLPTCVAVADGMGGTQQGEQAAELAVQALPAFFRSHSPELSTTPEQHIITYFQTVNQNILDHAGGTGIAGSTLSLLLFHDQHFTLGHLGDSRIYLWRHKKLYLLTQDHNAFGSLLNKGYVPFYPQQCQLSSEDRQYLSEYQLLHSELFYIPTEPFPSLPTPESLSQYLCGQIQNLHQQQRILPTGPSREKLLWALGKSETFPLSHISPPLPPPLQSRLQPGDLFLLSTDGLHGTLPFSSLEQRMQQIASRLQPHHLDLSLLSWGCDTLLQDACDSGSDDNISLLLVAVGHSTPPQTKASQPITPPPTSTAAPSPTSAPTTVVTIPSLSQTPPSLVSVPVLAQTHAEPPQHKKSMTTLKSRLQQSWPSWASHRQQLHLVGLYVLLGVLLILLIVSWRRPSSLPPDPLIPRRLSPVHPVDSKTGAFFWMPLPVHKQAPFLKHRIHALQQMYQDYHTIQSLWHFTKGEQQRILHTLRNPALQYHELQRILAQTPLEEHHFSSWDRAFQQAMSTLFELISPNAERYLDELNWNIPLPPSHPHLSISPASQREFRKKLLQRWQQMAPELRWKSWKLALLLERIGYSNHNPSPGVWQQRLQQLQQAHQRLQLESPNHPLLPGLSNRILLLQAHLRNLTPSPR